MCSTNGNRIGFKIRKQYVTLLVDLPCLVLLVCLFILLANQSSLLCYIQQPRNFDKILGFSRASDSRYEEGLGRRMVNFPGFRSGIEARSIPSRSEVWGSTGVTLEPRLLVVNEHVKTFDRSCFAKWFP